MSLIEQPLYNLLQKEPFYANFMLSSRIIFNRKDVERAAASVVKGEIKFYFNPEWYSKCSLEEKVAIMKHEILHVLFDHCGKRGQLEGNLNHKIKNVAMDCAINQYLSNLPTEGVTLEALEKQVKKKLEPFECWEYYYEHIKQHCKDNNLVQYVESQENDHHTMEEGEDSDSERAVNKAGVQDAMKKAVEASKGNVPSAVVKLIGDMNKSQLSWKQILRNFIANARIYKTKPTKNRTHRRFELDQPGRKKLKKLIVGVCTDSSGSVSDESYAKFMTEIAQLAKQTTRMYLIQADCEVHKVDVVKDGKAPAKVLTERHGSGGTAYQPAIDECVKRKCDAIIYFGDMDSADTPNNPGIPFLWVRVGSSEPPGQFGRVLDLN